MRKHQRWGTAQRKQAAIGILKPGVHRVRRSHSRERKEQAVRTTGTHEAVCEHERCLGLARAGSVLDREEDGSFGDGNRLGPGL
jgi:hypothetical protein